MNGIPQLSPVELKQRIDAGEDLLILDVREPHEYQIANLGGKLIPLGQIPTRLAELDPGREIVVHCKMGGRSQRAAEFLRQAGYAKVSNLAGGIHAWSREVDAALPLY